MNKETIVMGVSVIFLALIVIIRTIYLVKENRKLQESTRTSIRTLLDLSELVVASAGSINEANKKIFAFELDHLDLDLSLLKDAFELNSEAIVSSGTVAGILLDTIDERQNGKKTEGTK